MYYPSLVQVRELAKEGNLVPVYQEISADLETPVTAYMKVARKPYSFLLESIEGGERLARYSFIGTEPSKVIRTGPGQPDGEVDPLRLVEQALGRFKVVSIPGLPRFHGGHVGFLAYDAVHYFEPRVPPPASNPLDLPESTFMLADTLLVFDHLRQKIQVVSHAHIRGNNVDAAYAKATKRIDRLVKRLDRPLKRPKRNGNWRGRRASGRERRTYTSNRSYEEYDEIVRRSRDYIIAGDIIQVVPSQRLERPTEAAPLDLYRALRGTNPSPYMYLLGAGRLPHHWGVAGAAGARRGRAGAELPAGGHPPPRQFAGGGRGAGRGAAHERERARRAHHAGGPGPQRRGPRVPSRARWRSMT